MLYIITSNLPYRLVVYYYKKIVLCYKNYLHKGFRVDEHFIFKKADG